MGEVSAGSGGDHRRVMVAIDENDSSHYALMWVLDNLKESITTNNPLVIFMAEPPTKSNYTFAANLSSARLHCPISATPEFVVSAKENQRKLTLALLEKAKDICTSHGVIAETISDEGDPKATICAAVEKLNISLLVLGDRGLSKIKRALVGSVSNYCIHNAKCPVLVAQKP